MSRELFNKKCIRGFTLVEIMVALGIFAIVAVVAVGAFMKIIDANKKSQTLKTSINNINFALESLTREMRVGSMYVCGSGGPFVGDTISAGEPCDVSTPGVSGAYIAFLSSQRDPSGDCNFIHAYSFEKNNPNDPEGFTLYKAIQSNCGSSVGSVGGDEYAPVISPDAVIQEFAIKIDQYDSEGNPIQPKAFFHIKGYTGTRESSRTTYDIQTSISQRTPL